MENIQDAVKACTNELVWAIILPGRMRGEEICHSFHQKLLKKPARWIF